MEIVLFKLSLGFLLLRYRETAAFPVLDVMWVASLPLSSSPSASPRPPSLPPVSGPAASRPPFSSLPFRSVSFQAGLRAQLASIFDSNTLKQYPGPGVESRFNVLPRILSRVRKRLTTSRRGEFRACGGSLRTHFHHTPPYPTEKSFLPVFSHSRSSPPILFLFPFSFLFSSHSLSPSLYSSLISYLSARFIAHGDQVARASLVQIFLLGVSIRRMGGFFSFFLFLFLEVNKEGAIN